MDGLRIKSLMIRSTLGLSVLVALMLLVAGCSSGPKLYSWHTVHLTEEFTADSLDEGVSSFQDYLALEQRLFDQLQEQVYAKTGTGPEQAVNRYSRGSASDPERRDRDWNRTFEFAVDRPVGGVLLLHGMSDSPYSLRALGQRLHREGYHVIGLRLPGHGTAPSGLRHMTWQDMAAAVQLAIRHLAERVGERPLHLVGYSTGAALAINATLDALEDDSKRLPDSLVLISPAIRVHAAAALAGFKNSLSNLPGLDGMAYLGIMDEFDPFKYNSFATNAGAQVHGVTRDVDRRVIALAEMDRGDTPLPPVLVFKSTVDDTVTTEAVVDNLLQVKARDDNELVLFDINREIVVTSALLIDDPGPLTRRLIEDTDLPFALTLVGNASKESTDLVARRKAPRSSEMSAPQPLDVSWPMDVVSLSHVALPFPPDDPLYGSEAPPNDDLVYLGNLSFQGERGLLRIPESWLLRMRFNPFYGYLEDRTVEWMDAFRR